MNDRNLKFHNERKARDKNYYYWLCHFKSAEGRMPNYREMGEEYGFTRERSRQIYHRLAEGNYVKWVESAREHNQTPWELLSN